MFVRSADNKNIFFRYLISLRETGSSKSTIEFYGIELDCKLTENRSPPQDFPEEFCEILRHSIFKEHVWSKNLNISLLFKSLTSIFLYFWNIRGLKQCCSKQSGVSDIILIITFEQKIYCLWIWDCTSIC